MNKQNKVILTASILSALLLSGCGDNSFSEKSAEEYTNTFFKNLQEGNCGELSDDINIVDESKLFEDKDNEYSNKLMSYISSAYSYSVNSISLDDSKNIANVNISIRVKDIGKALTDEAFVKDLDDELDKSASSSTDLDIYKSTVIEYLGTYLTSDPIATVSQNVKLQLQYDKSNKSWTIYNQTDMVNTLLGKINDYYITSIYDEISSDVKLPEKISESTSSENTELTESISESTSTKSTTEKESEPSTQSESKSEEQSSSSLSNEQVIKDNKYYIPNDTEAYALPSTNKTTRSSRRSPIKIGDVATFDNLDYVNPHQKYKLEVTLNSVETGDNALNVLKDSTTSIKELGANQDYMLCSVTIKLIKNDSDYESLSFDFSDFDLYNYNDEKANILYLKGMNSLTSLKEGESSTGYIAYIYNKKDNVNLAFHEYMNNTLWFSVQ